MRVTKYMLIEQIVRRLNGGNPSASAKFWDEDVAIAVCQAINARLKADYITNTLAGGESIPEGSQLMTYTGDTALPLEKYGDCYNQVKLPCMPVKLIRDQGVQLVARDEDEANGFLWVSNAGQLKRDIANGLVDETLDHVVYTVSLDNILIFKDLKAEGVDKLMVKLLVSDVFSLDDYDALPISAEMVEEIVEGVYQKLVAKPPQDKRNDVTTVEP